MSANQQTSKITPREKQIAQKLRLMLEFIAKGDRLKTMEAKTDHAHQVVGWATGLATEVLEMLGEKP